MDVLKKDSLNVRSAMFFVILLCIVDFFADFTYEGARSVSGPFLGLLGASGLVVGMTAGLGEFVGYALRFISGTVADRTKKYWPITVTGYVVNLFSVPLLALSGHWPNAAALLITERTGRAIRAPARDAMLSHATQHMGRGWGFGLHEAMDQAGAVVGPLLMAAIIFLKKDYRFGFALLIIPATLSVATLLVANRLFPRPQDLETKNIEGRVKGLTRAFWIYLAASGLIAAGYADFALIAYHFQKTSRLMPTSIPLIYSLAMGVHALAALFFGRLYDRVGLKILISGILLSCFFAPLVFWANGSFIFLGIVLWGLGLGATESVMRAAVADMSSADRRGTAYGIFNAGYGIFWFAGSAFMGWLYDRSIAGLVVFSVATQLIAIPLILLASRRFALKSSQLIRTMD